MSIYDRPMMTVELADRLAGGPREDLDDVVVTDPVPIRYVDHLGLDAHDDRATTLAKLQDLLVDAEIWPEIQAYSAEHDLMAPRPGRTDGTTVIDRIEADQKRNSYSKMRSMMLHNIGRREYVENDWCTKRDAYDLMTTLGYVGSLNGWYRHLHENGLHGEWAREKSERILAARREQAA